MYKFNLTNATVKTILKLKNFSISRIEFREGIQERKQYDNRRRLAIIFVPIFGKRKVTFSWTNLFGKEKTKTVKFMGGVVLSW